MIKAYIDYWNKDSDKLEEYFKTNKQSEYYRYEDLVKLVFDIIVNPNCDGISSHEFYEYDTKNILSIDDGDYQGTLIFVLHENTYQPSVTDYVYTSVYYGSCEVCDILQGIRDYCDADSLPTDEQIKDYMTLCLHLLENCHYMMEE